MEMELPVRIKSEVILGHSSEHVRETVEYMSLESKKEELVPVCLLLHNKLPQNIVA